MSAASPSSGPAATTWPAPFMLAGVSPCCSMRGEHLVRVAAQDGGHPGRGLGARGGHGPAADGGQRDRRLDRQHAGQRGGGQLADAVPGDDDVAAGVRRVRDRTGQAAELAGDEQAHRDDERLGDRGVLDRLGVAGRAERQQVGVGDRAGPAEEGLGAGEVEPVGEHSGLLGTLSGGEDGQHVVHRASDRAPVAVAGAARKHTADLCRDPPKLRAAVRAAPVQGSQSGGNRHTVLRRTSVPERAVAVQPRRARGRPAGSSCRAGRWPTARSARRPASAGTARCWGARRCARALASRLPPLLSTARTVSSTSPPAACSGSGDPLVQRRAGQRVAVQRALGEQRVGRAPAGAPPARRRRRAGRPAPPRPTRPARSSPSTTGPATTGPAPNSSLTRSATASRSVACRPRTTTSWSACTPTSTSLRIDRAARRTAACGSSTPVGAAPTSTTTGAHRRPAQGGGPARTARRTARRAPARRRRAPPGGRPRRRGSRRSWRRRARWRRRPRG